MTAALGFLSALALVLLLGGITSRLDGEAGWPDTLLRAFFAGALGLHLALAAFDGLGLRWSFPLLVVLAVPTALVYRRWHVARSPVAQLAGPGAGDLVALGIVLTFAFYVLRYDAVTPDFYYHWGLKARRYLWAHEYDLGFLLSPGMGRVLRHYPCLWIDLLATSGLAVGSFSIRAALSWSVLVFGMMLIVVRRELVGGSVSVSRQLLLGAFALLVGGFALVHLLGGQADWVLALALIYATPGLLDARRAGAAREISLAAAVAAATKIEGVPLAMLLLVASFTVRRESARLRGASATSALRDSLPGCGLTALAAGVWLARRWIWELDNSGTMGHYTGERLRIAVAALGDQLASGAQGWGPTLLVLLALPWFGVRSRTRRFGLVVTGQLAAIVLAYSGGNVDVAGWVATSFPRLLFHVVPALLLVLFLELARADPAAVPRNPR